jgi:hypothetical protein
MQPKMLSQALRQDLKENGIEIGEAALESSEIPSHSQQRLPAFE